jgi:hypothetical protein
VRSHPVVQHGENVAAALNLSSYPRTLAWGCLLWLGTSLNPVTTGIVTEQIVTVSLSVE